MRKAAVAEAAEALRLAREAAITAKKRVVVLRGVLYYHSSCALREAEDFDDPYAMPKVDAQGVSVRLEVRWLWPTITKDMVEAAFLHYGTIVHVVIESPTWGAEDRRATRSASASACATSSRTSPSYSDKASAVAAQREMQVFIFIGAPGARDTLSFASTSAWLDDDDDDADSPEDYTARGLRKG